MSDAKIKPEKKNFIIDESGKIRKVHEIEKKYVSKKEKVVVTEIGFYLITPLLAGVFLGIVADQALHTKPMVTLIGLLFGVGATFYNLLKFLKHGK